MEDVPSHIIMSQLLTACFGKLSFDSEANCVIYDVTIMPTCGYLGSQTAELSYGRRCVRLIRE